MRLIDADALSRAIKTECNPYGKPTIDFESGKKVLKIIDNAPTVNEVRVIDTNAENNSGNALLKDIAHSLAIIADNSKKNGNTQESGNETLHWVHSEAHRVMCPKCGCRVSMTAAYEMNYCFKCGAKLGGIKNE